MDGSRIAPCRTRSRDTLAEANPVERVAENQIIGPFFSLSPGQRPCAAPPVRATSVAVQADARLSATLFLEKRLAPARIRVNVCRHRSKPRAGRTEAPRHRVTAQQSWEAEGSFANLATDSIRPGVTERKDTTMTAENDTRTMEGGCTCGAVRYRMTSEPMFVHCCHCRWCQRETGASFALNAMIEADRVVQVQGEPETVNTPSNSGKGQKIVRCPNCRVALWSHYGGAGDAVSFVRVGTLDEPDRLPPDIHIFTASKQPWVVLPPDVPAVERYYDCNEYWPEESLARRRALFG